jgi:large subunit ribosomal protein L44
LTSLTCRNYDAELHAFGNRVGEKFNDGVLRRALTHKSYLEQEAKKLGAEPNYKLTENEELVAVGEQFISRTIRGYLRAVFSRAPEEMIW